LNVYSLVLVNGVAKGDDGKIRSSRLMSCNLRATDPKTVTVSLRGMDEDLWRTFKAGAMLRGMTVAEGVEEALIQYFKVRGGSNVK